MAFSWGPTKVTQYPRAFLCIEKHILYFSTVFSIQIYEMKYQHVPNNWAEHMCHNWMCVLTFKQQWEMAKLVSIAVGSIHVKVGVLVIYHCIISHPKRCCCWVAKLYLTLCDPMDCSTPGSSVLNCLPEFAQIHVCCVGDAIWPSHPLSLSSPFALNVCFIKNSGLTSWIMSPKSKLWSVTWVPVNVSLFRKRVFTDVT